MTESSLPRSFAKSTQVGAIFLQCPHHGAKNLTKLTCSGGAIDDEVLGVEINNFAFSWSSRFG